MCNVACHHAKRLYALIMPYFIVFLCQHLHALIDFFQISNLLLLVLGKKMVAEQHNRRYNQGQYIQCHNPSQHHHHTVQWTREFLYRNRGIYNPALSLDQNRLKRDNPSDFR